MQISEVFLFSWQGFLHHTMTIFWHWCWIQMQTSLNAVVKPLGFWVIVLGTAQLQSVPCMTSASTWTCARLILKMCSVCFVFQWPDTAHLCVSLSLLQFSFLCCCTTKRQKGWNRLIGHGTHMAGISIGQVTEHHVSPDAAKATPKFSPSRHDSLVCMKKINIFLLASVLLLCICLAGFSSVRLAHLYLLPTCANFRRISAFTWLLSVPVLVPSLVSCAI